MKNDTLTHPSPFSVYKSDLLYFIYIYNGRRRCNKIYFKNNIEGVIIECGVDTGHFEHIWINELIKNNAVRNIYLYDTFGGLVKPTDYDYTCKDAKLYQMNKDEVYNTWKSQIIDETKNGWCYTPLENVQNRLNSTGYPQSNLHYVVGDVMETLKDKTKIPEK